MRRAVIVGIYAEVKAGGTAVQNDVFRKESLERAASPERLDEYIRVANPSVWVLLGAVAVFLIGVIVWAALTKTDGASLLSLAWN